MGGTSVDGRDGEFRGRGLRLGSGAIESSIRRVINQRLKGNGIFWLEDHAKEMLPLRALVIGRRWDERVKQMRSWVKKNRLSDPESQECFSLTTLPTNSKARRLKETPGFAWMQHMRRCLTSGHH